MKEFDETFERVIQNLNFQLKAYDGVTQLIAKIKQRSIGLPGSEDDGTSCDTGLKGIGKEAGLLTVKGGVGKVFEYVGPGVATLSVPDVGSSRVATALMKVVLPAPLGPSRAVTRPDSATRSSPSSAWTSP